jgi:hypothetical protein
MNDGLMPATPWTRMWARYFDYFIHCMIIVVLWEVIDPESLGKISNYLLGFLLMVVWIVLDGAYMATFGTTLGRN